VLLFTLTTWNIHFNFSDFPEIACYPIQVAGLLFDRLSLLAFFFRVTNQNQRPQTADRVWIDIKRSQ